MWEALFLAPFWWLNYRNICIHTSVRRPESFFNREMHNSIICFCAKGFLGTYNFEIQCKFLNEKKLHQSRMFYLLSRLINVQEMPEVSFVEHFNPLPSQKESQMDKLSPKIFLYDNREEGQIKAMHWFYNVLVVCCLGQRLRCTLG